MPTSSSPFTLPVRDLVHRPGEMRERELTVTVPDDLGEGLVAVRAGTDIEIDVRLEGLHEGILVSGDIRSTAAGVCGRCLRDMREELEVEFTELFAYTPQDADDHSVRDDHVDLEPVVRDAVVLALPFQPVCQPDCPGLDPVTGERLSEVQDREPQQVIDPRWAALEGLLTEDGTPSETHGGAGTRGGSQTQHDEGSGDGAGREKR